MMEATRALFGPEVKRRVLVGTFVLSSGYYEAYYGRAQAFRRRLKAEAQALFREVDLLLLPTTPTPPSPSGPGAIPSPCTGRTSTPWGRTSRACPPSPSPRGLRGTCPWASSSSPLGEDEASSGGPRL